MAEAIRTQRSEVVIDPTALIDVPAWEQYDYHALWVAVIETYVDLVVFLDNWQYSVGCTTEFGAALRLGLPVVDRRFVPFTYFDGIRLLEAAVAEVGSASESGHLLAREVDAIKQLVAETADFGDPGGGEHGAGS